MSSRTVKLETVCIGGLGKYNDLKTASRILQLKIILRLASIASYFQRIVHLLIESLTATYVTSVLSRSSSETQISQLKTFFLAKDLFSN